MSEKKPALKDRVSEKMGMAAWMHELYYQNASMFMSDPRHKQLPPYLQTSGVSSTFIALKAALDKIREDRHSALATVWTENPGSTHFFSEGLIFHHFSSIFGPFWLNILTCTVPKFSVCNFLVTVGYP